MDSFSCFFFSVKSLFVFKIKDSFGHYSRLAILQSVYFSSSVESLELFCEVGALTERPLSLLLYQYYNYYCFVLDLVGKLFSSSFEYE